jgi:negative regulator of flagellin synthesis FlgM
MGIAAMVIDPNNGLNPANTGGAKNRGAGGVSTHKPDSQPAGSNGNSAASGDSVVLSSEAQTLNRLEAQINASPEVDAARVAAIKEAIANGSFEINSERIAERMLDNDDMLG